MGKRCVQFCFAMVLVVVAACLPGCQDKREAVGPGTVPELLALPDQELQDVLEDHGLDPVLVEDLPEGAFPVLCRQWLEALEDDPDAFFAYGAPGLQFAFDGVKNAVWSYCGWKESGSPATSGEQSSGLPERTWAYESPDQVSVDRFDFAQDELDAAVAVVRNDLEEESRQEYTISLTIEKITPSPEKTAWHWAMYFSPESEMFLDWSEEDMLTRFMVVEAAYDAEYDGTKTFLPSGKLTTTYFLVKEGEVWTIWSKNGSAGT